MTNMNSLSRAQKLHLNPEATEMMLFELNGVFRYADHSVVTPAYSNSVRQHVQTVQEEAASIIDRSVADAGLRDAITAATIKPIIVHDFGELVAEPVTSLGETDPDLQQALALANPALFEEQVAVYFFHAAAFCAKQKRPDEFHQFVKQVRTDAKVQENGFGLEQKTAENLLEFYQTVRSWMKPETFDSTLRSKQWGQASLVHDVSTMKYFYNAIEGQNVKPDFPGCFGKTVEKWEGTEYALRVNLQKKQADTYSGALLRDCPLDEQPRVNGRYELMLPKLHRQVQEMVSSPLQTAFAAMTREITRTAYETSRGVYQEGPANVIYKGQRIAARHAINLYDDILSSPQVVPAAGLVIDALVR